MRSILKGGEHDWIWQNVCVCLWERASREGEIDTVGDRKDVISFRTQGDRAQNISGGWLTRRGQFIHGNREEGEERGAYVGGKETSDGSIPRLLFLSEIGSEVRG